MLGQALLNLGSLGKEAHDTIDFGQAYNLFIGDVSNIGNAIDGHKVVLTGAGEIDVGNFDHFLNAHLVFDDGDFGELAVI